MLIQRLAICLLSPRKNWPQIFFLLQRKQFKHTLRKHSCFVENDLITKVYIILHLPMFPVILSVHFITFLLCLNNNYFHLDNPKAKAKVTWQKISSFVDLISTFNIFVYFFL
ncbi:hypothetical protein NL108_002104 [Boleophthalmus pectinirostris]|nr:hypothetical protein NL108_002104 [Boleophthalmus pectinirostris]